ncbi:MAG: tRNA-dihydrouridine synthase, partial [Lachnospiraceae bacterium]|nr:tRNA-dihydrouridine synthase [Lachnospiraceae bacterium]
MFKIGNVEIKNRVCVAPMAGITDLPYRIILKEMGAALMTTELVSSKGIFYKNPGN